MEEQVLKSMVDLKRVAMTGAAAGWLSHPVCENVPSSKAQVLQHNNSSWALWELTHVTYKQEGYTQTES